MTYDTKRTVLTTKTHHDLLEEVLPNTQDGEGKEGVSRAQLQQFFINLCFI